MAPRTILWQHGRTNAQSPAATDVDCLKEYVGLKTEDLNLAKGDRGIWRRMIEAGNVRHSWPMRQTECEMMANNCQIIFVLHDGRHGLYCVCVDFVSPSSRRTGRFPEVLVASARAWFRRLLSYVLCIMRTLCFPFRKTDLSHKTWESCNTFLSAESLTSYARSRKDYSSTSEVQAVFEEDVNLGPIETPEPKSSID